MSDQERLDSFLERLNADAELAAIALVLMPYRAMMRDPSTIVIVIEKVVEHWHATEEIRA